MHHYQQKPDNSDIVLGCLMLTAMALMIVTSYLMVLSFLRVNALVPR